MNRAKFFRDQHPGKGVVKRTPNSIHLEGDGPSERIAYISASNDMHLEDGTEIDTAWQPTTEGGWQWEMTLAEYQAYSRSGFADGNLIRFQYDGEYVQFDPQSINWLDANGSRSQIAIKQAVTAVANDDLLTWTNAYGAGRHVRYQCIPEKLAKEIVIDNLTDLPEPPGYMVGPIQFEAEFTLSHSAGVEIYLDGSLWAKVNNVRVATAQAIEFRDAETGTNTIFSMPVPLATDSNFDIASGSFEVRNQSGTYYVTLRIAYDWIQSAAFPIKIDPAVNLTAFSDGTYDDGGEWGTSTTQSTARSTRTASAYNYTTHSIGCWFNTLNSSYYYYRYFVAFNTSSLYPATLTSIRLRLYVTSSPTAFNGEVYRAYIWNTAHLYSDKFANLYTYGTYLGDLFTAGTTGEKLSGSLSASGVNLNGYTWLAVVSEDDGLNVGTVPEQTSSSGLTIGAQENASTVTRPYLNVIYDEDYQALDPDGDVSTGGWTTDTGGTSNLYAALDEGLNVDLTDYVISPVNPSSQTFEVTFSNPGGTPEDDTNHVLAIWYGGLFDGPAPVGGTPLTFTLLQGTTTIKTWTRTPTDETPIFEKFTLLTSEAANITDYTNLRLRVTANV